MDTTTQPPANCMFVPRVRLCIPRVASVLHLKANGWNLRQLILMDETIEDEWRYIWQYMAAKHEIQLIILTSYIALRGFCESSLQTSEPSLVIYINGSMRFAESTCIISDPIDSGKAAVAFWRWCSKHALNAPVNFVRTSVFKPSLCTSWEDLANKREEGLKDIIQRIQLYGNDTTATTALGRAWGHLQGQIAQLWGRLVRIPPSLLHGAHNITQTRVGLPLSCHEC